MDLSDLNDAQRAAVTAGPGPHLVVAGAGTGKTRTLVHRVAWLISQGVPASGIVLLTFTRRAAREMLDRVAELVGPDARSVRGGTFHGFAHERLRRYAAQIGYTRQFTVMDREDAEQLVGMARAQLGLAGAERRFPRKSTVLSVLSKAINTGRTLERVLSDDWPQYQHEADDIRRIGEQYQVRKQQRDLMDYDDLLVLLARLLETDDAAREAIARECEHVLVDEYQDTNRLQGFIAGMLASEHGNLMVVGDEAQSIYAFRGAAVENILDFPRVFAEAQVTLLEQNYRSTPQILDLANGVLASAAETYGKRLWSEITPGDRPELVEPADEHEQAERIVASVMELREQGVGLERQAVLFRSASHANLVEISLSAAGIPFRKYGGVKFTEAAHVKDVVALLRLVLNPRDTLSWFRVLGWCEGLGARTAEQLAEQLTTADPPVLDAQAFRKKKYHAGLVSLADLLAQAGGRRGDLGELVQGVILAYTPFLERLYDDATRRAKDLDAFELLAARHDELDTMLAELTLEPPDAGGRSASEPSDEGMLTLSTIHSAKGLEWDTVYVMQLGDGAFPSGFTLGDPKQLEEERRLFYVAVTRARRRLILLQPRWLEGRFAAMSGPGCLLLDTIGALDDLVERVRHRGRALTPAGFGRGDGRAADRVTRLKGYFR